jgi:FO synthase
MTVSAVTALGRSDLLASSAVELAADAYAKARAFHGWSVTYSPKAFIPLTKLCRDRCGYCTFAQAPARVSSPFMDLDEILTIAQEAEKAGVTEALFTLGERPELRYDEAAKWLAARGYKSTVDYLVEACRMVLNSTGLLPHANAGALYPHELAALREVSVSQGMMLESLAELEAHRLAPDKSPGRRMATLTSAGGLQIPFTTGLLVGIGESRSDRLDALEFIAQCHNEYGHVQEVIIQNFLPKPRTAMAEHPAASDEEFHWTIAAARLVLPGDIHLQAPPNLSDDPAKLLAFGIDDFGGISPITIDHVNPERAWPAVRTLEREVSSRDLSLIPRLTIYPSMALNPERFLDERLRGPVLALSDAEGLGRESQWCSGGELPPPPLTPSAVVDPRISEILRRFEIGKGFTESELTTLFGARGGDVQRIADLADDVRRQLVGDEVTYVINRNINYTNVCTFKCRFCAFSKGPLSLNLRGDPYLLSLDEVGRRVREAEERGATEVCLQGGIHPNFDDDYYVEVVKSVREASPTIHIHAFSALEVFEGAKRGGVDLRTYLRRLGEAGLKTLPGTAAEILDDDVRQILCPDKISTQQWLDVHEAAHDVGLKSNVTIMFGAVESPRSWAKHLIVTRDLALRTGGFTEFVPLPFVHMATPLYLRQRSRKGPTWRENVLMHAIGRLHYAGVINNIQASWVKLGPDGTRALLAAGVNDVGGTLMDENISRAAGASHGQEMDEGAIERLVVPSGRPLAQRTTLYGRV